MNNKNLFIIFGTTSGIGRALYGHASNFCGNDFILFNKDPLRVRNKNIISSLKLDLSKSFTKAKLIELEKLFLKQKKYKNIYLVLNASIVEPIGLIGSIKDNILPKAGFVNFINYERIINIFVKATANLKAKKKILAISSGAAESPTMGLASYCSTKVALEMFIKCLFLEQQEAKKFQVIALHPGVVNTGMQKKLRGSKKENFPESERYKKIFKEGKLLEPEIVAGKIYSLLNSSRYWSAPIIDISQIK